MKSWLAMPLVLLLTACAQNLWVKPNAGQGDFEKDRYACLQQSQQQFGFATIDRFGGSAVNSMQTNNSLFSSCMNSRGWTLKNKDAAQAQIAQNNIKVDITKQRLQQIKKKAAAVCARDDLREYYKKTACLPRLMTFEQLADESKITPAQKVTLVKQRAQVSIIDKETEDALAAGGPSMHKALTIMTDFWRPETEKNDLNLYNGKITWGEYNKKRKEIVEETRARIGQ